MATLRKILVLDEEPVFLPEILEVVSNFSEKLNACARDTRIYTGETKQHLKNDEDVVDLFCHFIKTRVPIYGQTINFELVRLLSQPALFILFGSYRVVQKFIEANKTIFIDSGLLYVRLLLCLDILRQESFGLAMFNREFRLFANRLVIDVIMTGQSTHICGMKHARRFVKGNHLTFGQSSSSLHYQRPSFLFQGGVKSRVLI